MKTLAILGYHKIGPPSSGGWETWYYIPEPIFAAQLAFLRDGGWTVLGLDAFLRGLEQPELLPPRSALITFDDGYRSTLGPARSCLQAFGYPAVIFVPTAFIGGTNGWDDGIEPAEPICDWADLGELERSSIAVQSHGASHRAFSTLGPEELEAELNGSRACLEAGLNRPVELFSFPYGDEGGEPQATAAALARAGYRAACRYGGAGAGLNRLPGAEPFRLRRISMGPETDLARRLESEPAGVGA
jgi:peptidoglycan/xylan/chitin deacetylase (PgdA/CDA1 family)